MIRRVRKLWDDRRGGTVIEYGLIAAVVALAMLGALMALAGTTYDMWTDVAGKVVDAGR